MKRTIGIILLVLGIALGIYGFTQYDNSKAGIEIGNLEISAKDEGKSNVAFITMIIGGVGLIAGLVLMTNGRRG